MIVVDSLCDNGKPLQDLINTSTLSLLNCSCFEGFRCSNLFHWQRESKYLECSNKIVQSRYKLSLDEAETSPQCICEPLHRFSPVEGQILYTNSQLCIYIVKPALGFDMASGNLPKVQNEALRVEAALCFMPL